jgi:hypothetical protein
MTEKKEEHTSQEEDRKPYNKPEIIHDIKLETRAGSSVNRPDPLDFMD